MRQYDSRSPTLLLQFGGDHIGRDGRCQIEFTIEAGSIDDRAIESTDTGTTVPRVAAW
jgi:hypothetical protein